MTVEEVRGSLDLTDNGAIKNSIRNCLTVFQNDPVLQGAVRYNILTERIDIVKPLWWSKQTATLTDTDLNYLMLYLEDKYSLTSEKKIQKALSIIADSNKYHPIRDYLNGLEWDGTERIRYALPRFLGAEEGEYTYQALRLFMLGAISRVFKPGCKFEVMLCLVGGQGAGKSTFFRLLAVKDEWFSDDLKKIDDDNVYRKMQGHWIIEMSEMIATANAKSIEDIKSFISRAKETYADDFKIFCSSHADAVKAYHATAKWLKDRLGLDISPEKSRIVNLKRQYSEFLGFKLKVRKRSDKYVVHSHLCDKAYKKVQKKLTEEVKKLEHTADDKAQFMQLMTYNAVVAGIHQYYCIATAVSEDFGKLAYGVKKQLHNRLRNDLTRKGELKKGYIKEKYGKSSQLRFLHGRPVVPIGYVQSRNAQHKRKSVNKYTPEGRELIHKNLNIDTKTMLWLMRNPVQGRSIEYADNRISLYAAQHGKCAVTGEIMEAHEIHCHHKKPVAKGGTDEYQNLVLVSIPVHKLIHASDKATIRFCLNLLNLDSTQISKLNKFREMAEMPLID